jgi:signal transduction histidine kinase
MPQVATVPAAQPEVGSYPASVADARIASQPFVVDEFDTLARAYAQSQAFVWLLAHELRSKLWVTELSMQTNDEEGSRAAFETVHRMQDLVEGLLELARGREGDPTDAGSATRRVLDEIDAPGVDFVVADLPVVSLPRVLLETVLRNLIVNAVQAGASRIAVSSRPAGTICVSDDGPGVPAAKAERIFGVYTSKFGGAGLGLTLCREILRRRGGDIWLERPTTFCFRVR